MIINQSWIFIGRTNADAETPILWPPDGKNWLIWKDPDAGIDWRQEERGTTEDEMVGWHHRLDEHGFGWTLGVGDGRGGLACCGSWGRRESDTTEQLIWTELNLILLSLDISWPHEIFHTHTCISCQINHILLEQISCFLFLTHSHLGPGPYRIFFKVILP